MSDRTAATLARTIRAAARRVARPAAGADLLAAFARDRDPAAFEGLVRRYGPLVRAACRAVLADPADADDAFQAAFVALHAKAHTIRDARTLGGWLFRVARRSALAVKAAGARRRCCEARAARREPVGGPDVSWREACAVLHEELDRLPPRYRLPLILCYLDGKTRDEAAAELGWTTDSIRGRLDRGRARLRGRLEKRGITLSAVLVAAVAADALPPALVATTLTAARTAGPGRALPLAAGAWKAGLTAGLAAALVVGLEFRKDGAHGQPAPEKPKAIAEAPKKAEPDVPKTVTVRGIVVDPDGKGVGGTNVTLYRQDPNDDPGVVAPTDRDGRFVATVPEIAADTPMVALTAAGEFAAGWHAWTGPPPKEVRIVLAKDDVPIQGRIIDLQGKPLAGVTVSVRAVHAFRDDAPQAFADWLAGKRPRPAPNTLRGSPPGARAVVTGADGKFRFAGIGRDRVAQLLVAGPGITHELIDVATVAKLTDPGGPRANKTYPATFDHPSAPARLIRGTARDIDTGKPVAGLRVNGFGGAATVTTDAAGRYELPGYKKGPRYAVYARPADGSVYFPAMAEAADISGLDPLEIDLRVKAGVPVRGRLTEAGTGKPVVGTVRYWALAGNTHVDDVPLGRQAGEYFTIDVRTKPDGTFTCACLPGPGFLSVTAGGWYRAARVDPAGFTENAGVANTPDQLYVAVGGMALSSVSQEAYQAIRLLKLDPAKPPDEQVIELTPAEPIRGRFVGPDGKPLDGVRARGLSQTGDFWSEPLPAEVIAKPPHPDRPRRLTFRHDGRKLVGTALVEAGSAKPVEFKLEPWATLTGRLLDADGRPVARATLYMPAGRDRRAADSLAIATVFTDAAGKFAVDGLLPGVPYQLFYRQLQPPRRAGPATPEVTLKPGEERDLGDLKVTAQEP